MADGSKLRKTFFDNTKNEVTDYSGSFIYTQKGNLVRRLDYITREDACSAFFDWGRPDGAQSTSGGSY